MSYILLINKIQIQNITHHLFSYFLAWNILRLERTNLPNSPNLFIYLLAQECKQLWYAMVINWPSWWRKCLWLKKNWCLLILLRYFYQELKWYPHSVVILSCLKKDSQSAAKFYMGFSIVKRFLKGKEIQNHRSNVWKLHIVGDEGREGGREKGTKGGRDGGREGGRPAFQMLANRLELKDQFKQTCAPWACARQKAQPPGSRTTYWWIVASPLMQLHRL